MLLHLLSLHTQAAGLDRLVAVGGIGVFIVYVNVIISFCFIISLRFTQNAVTAVHLLSLHTQAAGLDGSAA